MKILAIRVKNLASLEGVTEIDFTKEPLKSAGIFAITGPMGAGKSTLLDALCLALFSKTPRHLGAKESGIELQDVASSKIGPGDVKGILRKGCGDGYAEVEFIGVDGNRYRSTWCVKRARNKIDTSLQPDTVSLINLSTNIPFPEKRKTEILKEIERLVGLNFEQFTRSVLLAQGEFTAFLKAEKDQKSSLLEKLTGTDIYSEISRLIYEKFRQAEQEYNDLQRQMEGIALMSEGEVIQLQEQQSAIGIKLNQLNEETHFLLSELNWHKLFGELELAKSEAGNMVELARQEKQHTLERITTFGKVEAVQGARVLFDTRTNLVNQVEQKAVEQEVLLSEISGLDNKLLVELDKLSETENTVLKLEAEIREAQPLIDKAKELDTLIREKNEQAKAAANESAAALLTREQHIVKIQTSKEELEHIALQLAALTQWEIENESRKPIAENLQLIISKLGDAGDLLLQVKSIEKEIETVNGNLHKEKDINKVLDETISKKEKIWNDLHAVHLADNNKLSAIEIDKIKAIEKLLNASIDETSRARGCWEILYFNQQEYEKINSKLATCKSEIISQSENLIKLNAELTEAHIRNEQSKKILDRAQLQIAENIEELRSQLADGDPCPVCGSLHHPFSSNSPSHHTLLEGLKNEYEECNATYNGLLKKCGSIEKSGESLAKESIGLEKELAIQIAGINGLTEKWETCNIDSACLLLPADERLAWLDNELIINRQALKEMQSQADAYDQLSQIVSHQKNEIYQLEKALISLKESRKDGERNLQNFTAEIKRLREESTASSTKIDKVTSELNPYFANTDWCRKWQQETVLFEQKINSFAKEWHEKINSAAFNTNRLDITKTELKGLQHQLESFELVVTSTASRLAEQVKSLSFIEAQRKDLFNGEEIGLVEQGFKNNLEVAQKLVLSCKAEKEKTSSELINLNSIKGQLNISITGFNSKIADLGKEIIEWLAGYNLSAQSALDEAAVISLLTFSTEWIVKERKSLQQIDDAIKVAETTFNDRGLQLSAHLRKKPSDRLPDNILERQLDLKQLIDTAGLEKNEIDFKLRQDAANRKQCGDIEKAIKLKYNIYENWQKLNDLLGSADGKKFRQIAQEYTLDILLGFTNIHLQELASRYKLSRVPNSLALQVLDHDMGDEIRSVHSLSGGESFLVSLALALGLASLSSNRMKVESLFIDEGFGSLDQATLVIAMNALEKLQNQGRKVGVISHVQEMTERITTQIRISKISNGRSRVEVTGVPV